MVCGRVWGAAATLPSSFRVSYVPSARQAVGLSGSRIELSGTLGKRFLLWYEVLPGKGPMNL
jgi:hypothetical protein